jgi:hypothetical protein
MLQIFLKKCCEKTSKKPYEILYLENRMLTILFTEYESKR